MFHLTFAKSKITSSAEQNDEEDEENDYWKIRGFPENADGAEEG